MSFQLFIMAFIVVKRQISRFATRGAQKSIGAGAPKVKLGGRGGGYTIKYVVNSYCQRASQKI